MRPYQVLVGANGSGKTTLLDIPNILGELCASRHVPSVFLEKREALSPRCSSLRELVHRGQGVSFILALEIELPEALRSGLIPKAKTRRQSDGAPPDSHLRYEVRIQVNDGREMKVRDEYLFAFTPSEDYDATRIRMQGENGAVKGLPFMIKREAGKPVELLPEPASGAKARSVDLDSNLLALPRVLYESESEFAAARWLCRFLVDEAVFYAPDWEVLRRASPPGFPKRVLPTAANLPWLLKNLADREPSRFAAWVAHVRSALPQVEYIAAIERPDDHHAYIEITYRGGHKVTSPGLSDGTLRILALTSIAYLVDRPAWLVTEEPENGIHPRAVEAVLQSLSAVYGSQVWLSTHSPVVLAHTKLDQILCMRLDRTGAVTVTPGNLHPRLVDWKGGIDIGSLFAAGVLG
jgi:predicted ATPase